MFGTHLLDPHFLPILKIMQYDYPAAYFGWLCREYRFFSILLIREINQ